MAPRNLLLLCLPWMYSRVAQARETTTHSSADFYTRYQAPLSSPECPEYEEDGILLHYDFADLVESAKSSKSKSAMMEAVKVHDHRHHRGSKVAAKSSRIASTRGIMYGNDWMLEAQLYQEIHQTPVPQITLEGIRPCLELGRPYLLTARIRVVPFVTSSKKTRLRRETNEFSLSDCAKSGENCAEIWTSAVSSPSNTDDDGITGEVSEKKEFVDERIIWAEPQSHHSRFGDVLTVATTITFGPDDSVLLFRGGPPESGIQVMEFTLKVPPQEAFRDSTGSDEEDSFMLLCPDLVPPNGNAEIVGRHPFPIYDNGSESNPIWATTSVVVEEDESDNHFFAVRGRAFRGPQDDNDSTPDSASSEGGLSWDIPRECLNQPYQTGAVYRYVT